jgi:hypothetical protein
MRWPRRPRRRLRAVEHRLQLQASCRVPYAGQGMALKALEMDDSRPRRTPRWRTPGGSAT